MKLKVTTLTGDKHELEGAPHDTVRDVKVSDLFGFDLVILVNLCLFLDNIKDIQYIIFLLMFRF